MEADNHARRHVEEFVSPVKQVYDAPPLCNCERSSVKNYNVDQYRNTGFSNVKCHYFFLCINIMTYVFIQLVRQIGVTIVGLYIEA